MEPGISNSQDSKYWRQMYRAALFEIADSKLPGRIAEAEKGGCATDAGIVPGSRRERRRDRGSGPRDVCFARSAKQLPTSGSALVRLSSVGIRPERGTMDEGTLIRIVAGVLAVVVFVILLFRLKKKAPR
jgi:hypothetical protein